MVFLLLLGVIQWLASDSRESQRPILIVHVAFTSILLEEVPLAARVIFGM